MNAPLTPQRLVATIIERIACKATTSPGISLADHTSYLLAEARDFPGAPDWLHEVQINEHGCITFPESEDDPLFELQTEIAGLKAALAKLQGENRALDEASRNLRIAAERLIEGGHGAAYLPGQMQNYLRANLALKELL